MSTQPPVDRVALDAAAVVQSLSRCAAEFQAKAAAHKAVVAAAQKRQMGLLAADAALMVEVYEDAAATMFSTIQGIVSGSGSLPGVAVEAKGESTDSKSDSLQHFCDGISAPASKLCRLASSGKVAAADRYRALVSLVRELDIRPVYATLPSGVHASLIALYAAIVDKLPDLVEVAKALLKIEQDWLRADGTSLSQHPNSEQTRRADWFKKMQGHVDALLVLRGRAVDGDATAQEPYERLVDVILANMQAQPWPGGEVAAMVEATRRELQRLRQDCGVVVAMARLGATTPQPLDSNHQL